MASDRHNTAEAASARAHAADMFARPRGKSERPRCGHAEPVAITGMGLRFPPDITTPNEFWYRLSAGYDGTASAPPPSRGDGDWASGLVDPSNRKPGKLISSRAGYLNSVADFDAEFFGISPREAARMDPQQRMLLQVAWHAMEDAGYIHPRLDRASVGLTIGVMSNDYARLLHADLAEIDGYSYAGYSFIPNRVSNFLDLKGPSVAIDSACSSSLTAVHLAVQGLHSGEQDIALAGATNLILGPHLGVAFSKWGMLSPDGRCKTFDAAANGFVRGEGCGLVVLRRLSDALANGDRVYAVILGSAVNQDGQTSVFTAPNGLAQAEVIRTALTAAGVAAGSVGYVEAHGTGTPLGDPIEIEALAQVYGAYSSNEPQCRVGAVKTNIGHLEAAAGIAGLIKAALCVYHGAIPPNRNFARLNPHIVLDGTRLALATSGVAWSGPPDGRRAGISSFGAGGTNAHVILGQAPEAVAAPLPVDNAALLLPVSAASGAALEIRCTQIADWLETAGEDIFEVCATAIHRRAHLPCRKAVVGRTREELAKSLRCGALTKTTHSHIRLLFVMCGQGLLASGMGLQLWSECPAAAEVLEICETAINKRAGWSLRHELSTPTSQSNLGLTEIGQPALFAIQAALIAQLDDWGIRPDAVIGYSVGEVAAAYAAGVLSLASAIDLVLKRGAAMAPLCGHGAMAAVGLSEQAARDFINKGARGLEVSAVNAPGMCVLGGTPEAITDAEAALWQQHTFFHRLPGDYAFHSCQMSDAESHLDGALAELDPAPAQTRWISATTGAVMQGPEADHMYWSRGLRAPVRFADAVVKALEGAKDALILEIGPAPALGPAIERIADASCLEVKVVPTQRPDAPGCEALFEALAASYAAGWEPRWSAVWPAPRNLVSLPPYPFRPTRHWVDPPARSQTRVPERHPLAGRSIGPGKRLLTPASDDAIYEQVWDPPHPAILTEHRVDGTPTAPFALLVLLLEAAARAEDASVAEVVVRRRLDLSERVATHVQIIIEASDDRGRSITLYTREADVDTWRLIASGRVSPARSAPPAKAAFQLPSAEPTEDFAALATRLSEAGLDYGPAYRGPVQEWRDGQIVTGRLDGACPVTGLDAAIRALLLDDSADAFPTAPLPIAVNRVDALGAGLAQPHWFKATRTSAVGPSQTISGDVELFDETEAPIAVLRGVLLRSAPTRPKRSLSGMIYETALERVEVPDDTGPLNGSIVLLGGHDLRAELSDKLRNRGAKVLDYDESLERDARLAPILNELDRDASVRVFDLTALDIQPSRTAIDLRQTQGPIVHAIRLVRAISDRDCFQPTRLAWVTKAAAGGDIVDAAALGATSVEGFARALRMERPELDGRTVDLPADAGSGHVDLLLQCLLTPSAPANLIVRDRAILTPRLRRATADAEPLPVPTLRGTHLVTGAFGALGLKVAARLAALGAENLILVGRSPPSQEAQRRLDTLQAGGTRLRIRRLDIAEEAALRNVIAEETSAAKPLRGVFHVAGVLEDAVLQNLTEDAFQRVAWPKIAGGLALHRATSNAPLDHFVLFSSVSAMLGSAGQAAYAATNAYLDGLARFRASCGLPALSIQWGRWDGSGMAHRAEAAMSRTWFARGLRAMPPEAALDALQSLLVGAPNSVVGVVDMDWSAFASALGDTTPEVIRDLVADAGSSSAPTSNGFRAHRPGEKSVTDMPDLETSLRHLIVETLGLAPDTPIDPASSLTTLGMDSMLALEIRNRLQALVDGDLVVPASFAFDYPTLGTMVDFLQTSGFARLLTRQAPKHRS